MQGLAPTGYRRMLIDRCASSVLLFFVLFPTAFAPSHVVAQSSPASYKPSPALPEAPTPVAFSDAMGVGKLPKAILRDQLSIWTSPIHVRTHDLVWLVPLAAATGAAIATDHRAMSTVVSHDPGFNQSNVNVSNGLVYSVVAAPAALYGFGRWRKDEHARETGILGAEALGDGVVLEQGLKLIFWRERPYQSSARGQFFQGAAGVDSSFPSSHSVLAWSSAAVLAEEYTSPWTRVGVYSLATGVSLTRVLGQQHFPTDVLVGSAAGWLIGHYVARAHHRRH